MATDILELMSDARDGVFAVDMDQRVVFWNRGAERILGYRAEEILGRQSCCQVLKGVSEQETLLCTSDCAAILLARRRRIPPSRTLLTSSKDGKPKWISITHVLLPGSSPKLDILIHIFHDATQELEAKRLVQQLNSLLGSPPPQFPAGPIVLDVETSNTVGDLSAREVQLIQLLAQGLGTKAIAELLVIRPVTVRNHIRRIFTKLGVHSRLEAVTVVSRQDML